MSKQKEEVFYSALHALEDELQYSSMFYDIFDAIKYNDFDAFVRLMTPQIKAEISRYKDDITDHSLLSFAAMYDNYEAGKYIVDNGASVLEPSYLHESSLSIEEAIYNNSFRMFLYLFEMGKTVYKTPSKYINLFTNFVTELNHKDIHFVTEDIGTYLTTPINQSIYLYKQNEDYLSCSFQEKNYFILNKDGRVYLSSSLSETPSIKTFQLIDFPETISHIAAGNTYLIALSYSNQLYMYGDISGSNSTCSNVRLIDFFKEKHIISIHSGYSHVIINTDKGLYSWGNNDYGQLGRSSKNPNIIERIPFDFEIDQISVSGNSTIILTKDQNVFYFPSANKSRLRVFEIQRCNRLNTLYKYANGWRGPLLIKQVFSCNTFFLILYNNKSLYTFSNSMDTASLISPSNTRKSKYFDDPTNVRDLPYCSSLSIHSVYAADTWCILRDEQQNYYFFGTKPTYPSYVPGSLMKLNVCGVNNAYGNANACLMTLYGRFENKDNTSLTTRIPSLLDFTSSSIMQSINIENAVPIFYQMANLHCQNFKVSLHTFIYLNYDLIYYFYPQYATTYANLLFQMNASTYKSINITVNSFFTKKELSPKAIILSTSDNTLGYVLDRVLRKCRTLNKRISKVNEVLSKSSIPNDPLFVCKKSTFDNRLRKFSNLYEILYPYLEKTIITLYSLPEPKDILKVQNIETLPLSNLIAQENSLSQKNQKTQKVQKVSPNNSPLFNDSSSIKKTNTKIDNQIKSSLLPSLSTNSIIKDSKNSISTISATSTEMSSVQTSIASTISSNSQQTPSNPWKTSTKSRKSSLYEPSPSSSPLLSSKQSSIVTDEYSLFPPLSATTNKSTKSTLSSNISSSQQNKVSRKSSIPDSSSIRNETSSSSASLIDIFSIAQSSKNKKKNKNNHNQEDSSSEPAVSVNPWLKNKSTTQNSTTNTSLSTQSLSSASPNINVSTKIQNSSKVIQSLEDIMKEEEIKFKEGRVKKQGAWNVPVYKDKSDLKLESNLSQKTKSSTNIEPSQSQIPKKTQFSKDTKTKYTKEFNTNNNSIAVHSEEQIQSKKEIHTKTPYTKNNSNNRNNKSNIKKEYNDTNSPNIKDISSNIQGTTTNSQYTKGNNKHNKKYSNRDQTSVSDSNNSYSHSFISSPPTLSNIDELLNLGLSQEEILVQQQMMQLYENTNMRTKNKSKSKKQNKKQESNNSNNSLNVNASEFTPLH